jgi:hypothetical protein
MVQNVKDYFAIRQVCCRSSTGAGAPKLTSNWHSVPGILEQANTIAIDWVL